MNARAETTHDDERYYETDYTIFVMVDGNPTQLPPATTQGYDENGSYGTGFTLTVHRGAGSNTATKQPRAWRAHTKQNRPPTTKRERKEKHKP